MLKWSKNGEDFRERKKSLLTSHQSCPGFHVSKIVSPESRNEREFQPGRGSWPKSPFSPSSSSWQESKDQSDKKERFIKKLRETEAGN